jgi:hypothetical protein
LEIFVDRYCRKLNSVEGGRDGGVACGVSAISIYRILADYTAN